MRSEWASGVSVVRRRLSGFVWGGLWRALLAAATAALVAGVLTTAAASAESGLFSPPPFSKIPGQLPEGLYAASAAVLSNGDVLLAGGESNGHPVNTAVLFNPANGSFEELATQMAVRRAAAASVALPGGEVLILGGEGDTEHALKSAEIYNPASGRFEATAGPMTTGRDGPGAAVLSDGKVLITGGRNSAEVSEKTAEFYDPSSGTFEALPGGLQHGRYQPAVVPFPPVLATREVLVAGGYEGSEPLRTAEVFDPATATFKTLEGGGREMTEPRGELTGVLMQDGFILLAGGDNNTGELKSEETFDYLTDTFAKVSQELSEPRDGFAAATLPDGRVLLAGGHNALGGEGSNLATAEQSGINPPDNQSGFETVAQTTATLHGAELSEAAGAVYFQYGTTTAYGNATPRQLVEASLAGELIAQPSPRVPGIPTYFAATVSGLLPATAYHWRAVTENVGGISYGADRTFTTAPAPGGGSPEPMTAPGITLVGESHRTWREGSKFAQISSARRPPVGTVFKLALTEAANIKLVFTQHTTGRKVGHECVAQTRGNRHRDACVRTLTRGVLSLTAHAGLNEIRFQGRLTRTRTLPLGSYVLGITASNTAGHSKPETLTFTIVR